MKKLLSLFTLVLFSTSLFAYDFEVDNIYYNILGSDSVEVTSGDIKYSDSVIIPSIVKHDSTFYHITAIGEGAFYNCTDLTAITIPNSVTAIGDNAFRDCSSLTSITIPNNVTTLGGWAFHSCSSLTSVIWNAKNCADFTSRWRAPFYSTASIITSFTFGDSIQHIPANLCLGMDNLDSITIPNSVVSIGESAFYDCSHLSTITCLATTPPTIYENTFMQPYSGTIIIPCGTLDLYTNAIGWSQFTNYQEPSLDYTFSAVSANNLQGHVSIIQEPNCQNDTVAIIEARPNRGYKFKIWNDSVTDTKRTIILRQDTALIANFDSLMFTISTAVNYSEWGTVIGAGTYQDGKTITLTAIPNEYYKFVSWNDGNTDNPRTITVSEDIEYTANFASEIRVTDVLLSQAKIELSKGNSRKLEASVLPFDAFNQNIIWTCSDEKIAIVSDGWVVAQENGTAMVRVTSEDGGFYKECHVSVGDEYDKVQVTPSSNSAGFVWSMVEEANKYILIIWVDAEQTQKLITMIFNSQGQLTSMEIHPQNAPRKAPSQVNSGFNFTVTGLEENTTYSFVMDSYNLHDEVIDSQVGQFTTTTTDLENTFINSANVHKVLENGTIYILRNGKKYTIDGRKVE